MPAPTPPPVLVRLLNEGRCILFVGSGLSAAAGLPTWKALLETTLAELQAEDPTRDDVPELQRLLDANKFLEVADYCKEQFGEQRYSRFLADHLRGTDEDIPEAHQLIVKLPFAACVTTNYDKLLERAYQEFGRLVPRTPVHSDVDTLGPLLFDKSFFLLKSHGDIDRPETLILTSSDYQKIIHANPAFNAVFSAILLTHAILFVGYSMNDPDFRILLDKQLTIFNRYTPERYALMAGVGKVERDVMWRTARIRVLPYPDGQHEQVPQFLRHLLDAVAAGGDALPPPETTHTTPGTRSPSPEPTRSETESPVSTLPPRGYGYIEMPAAAEPAYEAASEPSPDSVAKPAPVATLRLSWVRGQIQTELFVDTDNVHARKTILAGDPWTDLSWTDLSQALRSSALHASGPPSLHKIGGELRELSTLIAACLPNELADLPHDAIVAFVTDAALEAVPWELAAVDGTYLCLRHPVVRAPVGISAAARGRPHVQSPTQILLVGDTLGDLPGAHQEVLDIAAIYADVEHADCTVLAGSEATFDALAALWSSRPFDVVHFAGHAWQDDQESYLLLSGGVELRANELRSLLGRTLLPILVFNSHYTSFVPLGGIQQPTGDTAQPRRDLRFEHTPTTSNAKRGFTDVAMAAGVGAFVGAFGSVSDEGARMVGVELHRELAAARTPIVLALHEARQRSMAQGRNDVSALLYSLSGYPDMSLPGITR